MNSGPIRLAFKDCDFKDWAHCEKQDGRYYYFFHWILGLHNIQLYSFDLACIWVQMWPVNSSFNLTIHSVI